MLSQSVVWLVEVEITCSAKALLLHQICGQLFDVLSHIVQEFFLSARCTTWNKESCKQLLVSWNKTLRIASDGPFGMGG